MLNVETDTDDEEAREKRRERGYLGHKIVCVPERRGICALIKAVLRSKKEKRTCEVETESRYG